MISLLKVLIFTLFCIIGTSGQKLKFQTPAEQRSCHQCLATGSTMCKFGGFPGETDTYANNFRYTGYESSRRLQSLNSKCCEDWRNCGFGNKTEAFCSHQVSDSMKYTFCDYNQNLCMDSQAQLIPSYYGRQVSGTAPGAYYTNSSCYWQVGLPSKWTDNSVLKIKITSLKNATCWVNSGGTMLTSSKQVACKEGDVFTFNYLNMTQDQNIFLVSYATFIKPDTPPKPAAPPALFDPEPLVSLKEGSTDAETTAALTKFFYDVTGFAPSMSSEQLQTYTTNFYKPKRRLLQAATTPTAPELPAEPGLPEATSEVTATDRRALNETKTKTSTSITATSDLKTLQQASLYYANDQFTRYDTNTDKSLDKDEFIAGYKSDLAKSWTQVSYINDFRLLSGDSYAIDLAKLAKSDNAKYLQYAPTDTNKNKTVDFLEYTVWRVGQQKVVLAQEAKAAVELKSKEEAALKTQQQKDVTAKAQAEADTKAAAEAQARLAAQNEAAATAAQQAATKAAADKAAADQAAAAQKAADDTAASASTAATAAVALSAAAAAAGAPQVAPAEPACVFPCIAGNRRVLVDSKPKYNPDIEVDVIGHIEFEYWAENAVKYDKLTTYLMGGVFLMGVCICACLDLIWKNSVEESLTNTKGKVWRLRGKTKEYVETNADGVLEMVNDAQAHSYPNAHQDTSKLSKEQRIRLQKNELEQAWCFQEGLLPVKSVYAAFGCCFLNLILPGWGTIASVCFVTEERAVAAAPAADTPAAEEPVAQGFGDDEEQQDGEKKEEAKKEEPKLPPVVSLETKRPWSRASALAAGIGQLLTCICGIGWIWSISHGCVLFENALVYDKIKKIQAERDPTPAAAAAGGGDDAGDQTAADQNAGGFG